MILYAVHRRECSNYYVDINHVANRTCSYILNFFFKVKVRNTVDRCWERACVGCGTFPSPALNSLQIRQQFFCLFAKSEVVAPVFCFFRKVTLTECWKAKKYGLLVSEMFKNYYTGSNMVLLPPMLSKIINRATNVKRKITEICLFLSQELSE